MQLPAQNTWNSLSGNVNSTVRTIVADTVDSFYIGGHFTGIGPDSTAGIAYWNGSSYMQIGSPGVENAQVLSMIKFNNGLVAAGTFNYIDTTACNNIAFWDGKRWSALGNGLDYTGATTVSTLAIFENELYAGGIFTFSGADTVNNIAKWTGERWNSLGSGVNGTVYSICAYDGKLYVAGSFTVAGSLDVKNIARWDGSNWDYVDSGLEYTGATTVSTLRVYNGNLYAGGNYIETDTTKGFISKWDGTGWSNVGDGLKYTGATTVSTIYMYEFDKKLIVEAKYAVDTNHSDSFYAMQTWNDSTWEAMDGETDLAVFALEIINGTLYAGGDFSEIAGISASYVARWEATKKYTPFISEGFENLSNKYSVYPNPVKNELNIKTPKNSSLNPFRFSLTDVTGRQILEFENITDKITFERQSIHSGIYLYRITTRDGNSIQQGKLIFD